MRHFPFISIFIITQLICNISMIVGQQPYIGLGTVDCPNRGNSNSISGYTCNGESHSCQAYLTFRAQPLYSFVSTISSLLGSDPSQLSEINSVSLNDTFQINELVIVPVNCSCAGEYYQANTSYVVQYAETNFLIANNTFEGLTTCQALQHQNHNPGNMYPGRKIVVPLRCACPTKNQREKGVRYLLSYLVDWGDSVSYISEKFGVETETTLEANSLTMTKATIYPFTTLLVPLHDKPSSNSQTLLPAQQPPSTNSSSSSTERKSSTKSWVYVVVVVVIIVLILTLCVFIFFTRHQKGKKKRDPVVMASKSFEAIEKPQDKKLMEKESENILPDIISDIAQSYKVYSFEELELATDNFSPSCWIKGSVYRGVINGDLAAIKKIEGDVSKEIEVLNKVNHSNVIRLSGVSFNEGIWYLVYEYAANGALSDWIYSNNNKVEEKKFLSWTQRIQIALDVATGLDYLHSFTSPPHVHKDIKCSNILLNNDFRAKIANLRLARSLEDEFPMTRHIVGTRGYMAPEYLENGLVSTKLDVYAFGVLMLELLTGKEVDGTTNNLYDVLSSILVGEKNGLKGFLDPSLQENYPFELAIFVIGIIDNCIKKDPASRPAMHEIVPSLARTFNSSLNWEFSVNISGHSSS